MDFLSFEGEFKSWIGHQKACSAKAHSLDQLTQEQWPDLDI